MPLINGLKMAWYVVLLWLRLGMVEKSRCMRRHEPHLYHDEGRGSLVLLAILVYIR